MKKQYADVLVSAELLESLRKKKRGGGGMDKYWRFKNWLHYANLKSWQDNGWHFNYVMVNDLEDHCTCGLIVHVDDDRAVADFAGFELDRVQSAFGHRNLPSLKGQTFAFVVNYKWLEEKGVHWFLAFCQRCGASTGMQPEAITKKFCKAHAKSCLSVVPATVASDEETEI